MQQNERNLCPRLVKSQNQVTHRPTIIVTVQQGRAGKGTAAEWQTGSSFYQAWCTIQISKVTNPVEHGRKSSLLANRRNRRTWKDRSHTQPAYPSTARETRDKKTVVGGNILSGSSRTKRAAQAQVLHVSATSRRITSLPPLHEKGILRKKYQQLVVPGVHKHCHQ